MKLNGIEAHIKRANKTKLTHQVTNCLLVYRAFQVLSMQDMAMHHIAVVLPQLNGFLANATLCQRIEIQGKISNVKKREGKRKERIAKRKELRAN